MGWKESIYTAVLIALSATGIALIVDACINVLRAVM